MKNRIMVLLPRQPAFYKDFYEFAIQPTWESKDYVVGPPVWVEGMSGTWVDDLNKQIPTARLAIIDLTEGTVGLFLALSMLQKLQVDTLLTNANLHFDAPPAILGQYIHYGRENGKFSLVKLIKEMERLANELHEAKPRQMILSQETIRQGLAEIKKLWRNRVKEPQLSDALANEIRYEEATKDRRTQRLLSDQKVTMTIKASAFPQVGNSAQCKRILQDIIFEIFNQVVEIEMTPLITM